MNSSKAPTLQLVLDCAKHGIFPFLKDDDKMLAAYLRESRWKMGERLSKDQVAAIAAGFFERFKRAEHSGHAEIFALMVESLAEKHGDSLTAAAAREFIGTRPSSRSG